MEEDAQDEEHEEIDDDADDEYDAPRDDVLDEGTDSECVYVIVWSVVPPVTVLTVSKSLSPSFVIVLVFDILFLCNLFVFLFVSIVNSGAIAG